MGFLFLLKGFNRRRLGLQMTLVVLLSGFPALAKDTWLKVEGPNVTAVSGADKKKTRRLVREFEQFRAVFKNSFPGFKVDSDCPLLILVAKNKKQFRDLLPARWDEKEPAGYFQRGPERHFIVLRTDVGSQAYEVVYHEYVHFLLSLNFDVIPLWLNEGLAEFWSHIQFRKREVRIGLPAEQHLYHLNRHSLLPLGVLFSVDHESAHYRDPDKAGLFYGQSWALTHLLMLGDGVRERNLLAQLVIKVSTGMGEDAAYTEVLGDYGPWEKQLRNYVAQRAYHYLKLPSPIKLDEDELEVSLLSQAQYLTAQGYLMLQSGQTAEAGTLFDQALELDEKEPTAWEGKGLGALHQGDHETALECLAEAVKNNSTDYLTYYYLATLGMESGLAEDEIEHSFQKAIQLNPRFVRAYSDLGYWYASADRNLEEALRLYRKACNLEPRQLAHLDNLVRVLLRLGKLEEAEVLAKHLLRSAKSETYQTRARSHLAVIEAARTPMPLRDPVASFPKTEGQGGGSDNGSSSDSDSLTINGSGKTESRQVIQPTQDLLVQGRACRPYFVNVQGITPVAARLLALECGDHAVFVAEINGSMVRLTAADPALPVLFSCDIDMGAVRCGSLQYAASVYFDPNSERDAGTGASKVLAIELKGQSEPPWKLITGKLRSYPAAHRGIFSSVEHGTGRYGNN